MKTTFVEKLAQPVTTRHTRHGLAKSDGLVTGCAEFDGFGKAFSFFGKGM